MQDNLSLSELCALLGVTPSQVNQFRMRGLFKRLRRSEGYRYEHVLLVAQADQLVKAGLTGPQLQRHFAVLRAGLARCPSPEARLVWAFEAYVNAIVILADLLGKSDTFDAWLAQQRAVLAQAKSTSSAPRGKPGKPAPDGARRDRELFELFLASTNKGQQTAAEALAS